MKAYEQTLSLLKTLNLRGVVNSLDEVINDAEIRNVKRRVVLRSKSAYTFTHPEGLVLRFIA